MPFGVEIIDGVPHIQGKPAVIGKDPLLDCFSKWRCPICNAYLSTSLICLNGCYLGAEGVKRFHQFMRDNTPKEKDHGKET